MRTSIKRDFENPQYWDALCQQIEVHQTDCATHQVHSAGKQNVHTKFAFEIPASFRREWRRTGSARPSKRHSANIWSIHAQIS